MTPASPAVEEGDRPVAVGVSVHESLMVPDPGERRALLGAVSEAGLDHVTLGDHVSFHGGTGFDGLLAATSVVSTHDDLHVIVGVYQLALRHPMVVARQLSSLAQLAPGRITFGVGVGGEDRSEVSNCGVDPATRGRRVDEQIGLLRRLATGEAVSHEGDFFTLADAAVMPAPAPRIPIVVGGGGDAAVRRTARLGDGWLGLFCTARRFAETRERIRTAASDLGREPDWFGVTVWCGFDPDDGAARALLGERMSSLYRLPPERFGHLTGAGTPEQVAEFVRPYVDGGARHVTLVPVAADAATGVEMAGETARLLKASAP